MFSSKVMRLLLSFLLILTSLNYGMSSFVKAKGYETEIYKVGDLCVTEDAEDFLKSVGIVLEPSDFLSLRMKL